MLLGVVHHREAGPRPRQVDDRLPVDLLPVLGGRLLHEPEQVAVHEVLRGAGVEVLPAEEVAHLPHPRDPLVPAVPHQREVAAGLEHPRDLGERDVVVEPVEGLRHDDDVDGAVVRRDVLGGCDPGADLRHPLAQHLEHRLVGVGGEDRVPGVDELASELARAGAELEDDLGLTTGQPRDCLGGVGRAAPVVRLGDGPERPRAVDGGGGLGKFVAHRTHRIPRPATGGPSQRRFSQE